MIDAGSIQTLVPGRLAPAGPLTSRGDGTISSTEFQVAHERIFKAMDSNKDGRLTQEEMQAFMHGTRRSVPQQ